MTKVNETAKILPRITELLKGKTLLICREQDAVEITNGDVVQFGDFGDAVQESYDTVVAVIFAENPEYMTSDNFDYILDYMKPNGLAYLYFPHKFYCMDGDVTAVVPHDILLELKHVQRHQFELLDFQTFKDTEPYGSKDLQSIEYGFHILLKKTANTFGKKDLSDDAGQLMNLDD